MNSIEDEDKIKSIIKYAKYVLLLIILIVILFLFKGLGNNYSDVEKDMVIAAKKYVNEKQLNIANQEFIEITKLGEFKGTEFCKKASGVIVRNNNGSLTYQAYLKCDDYETKLNSKKNKYISLVGDEVVILNKGEIYEEKNYVLNSDEIDVVINGQIGNSPGIYTLSYNAYIGSQLKETIYRNIIVTSNDKGENVTGLINKEEPILTLKGDTDIVLQVGDKYYEEGYTAVDYEDGQISRQVKYNPNPETINTKVPKVYTIVYTVTNSKGKTAFATRKITVVKYKADVDISISKSTEQIAKEVTITLDIKGSGYDRIIKPEEEFSPHYSKTVRANGTYKFVILDTYKNEIIKQVEINNIDNIPPTGTCSALVQGNNSSVEVNASDNKGISGYSYIFDSIKTEYMTNSAYKIAQSSKSISVKVKDLVGNESTLKCDVTVKEEPTQQGRPSGSSEVIDTSEYKLVATKNDTVEFAKTVNNLNIAQTHPPNYPGYCLSFSYYHAYKLYNGNNLESMTADEGASYMYAGKFKAFNDDNKQVVLEKIYECINAGEPVILHVNGNKEGTVRHYVTVVGYKSSVTSGSTMSDQDLLIIDSHDGKLERMDRDSSRFMISGYDTGRTSYGYQIYILR